MMHRFYRLTFFAALMPLALTAGPILYTFSFNNSDLQVFDAATPNASTTIGNMGVPAKFGGLAYDTANSTMYMVDGFGDGVSNNPSSLYSVNLLTGVATLIGSTGLTEVTGLTYDSANNTLYAVQDDSANVPLQSLNTSTGAATAVGSGISTNFLSNLAYDSSNGVLYGWSDCLGCSVLYSIDPGTGVGTVLSSAGLDSNDSGLVYDPVTNLLWDLDVRGYLTTINPSTYAQVFVGTYTSGESDGLALIPGSAVPEPSTWLLLSSGVALLAIKARRSNGPRRQ